MYEVPRQHYRQIESMESYINTGLKTVDIYAKENISITCNDEFTLHASDRKYSKQFYSMYQYRLNTLKARVDENAMRKWGDGTKKIEGKIVYKKDKILDITTGEVCWVSGTVYSDLHNKLNILVDVEKGIDDTLPSLPKSYAIADEDDPAKGKSNGGLVMLEDESGRAILHNDEFLNQNLLVSGCIVGILGVEIQAGVFEIMEVIYPTISPQVKNNKGTGKGKGKIAFVSGLNMCSVNRNLKTDLLLQFLNGELGSEDEISKSNEIVQVIIAGNSIAPEALSSEGDASISTSNFGSKNISKLNVSNIHEFDAFIKELLPSVAVTILPGETDPGEICLPQQPLHKAFLQENKKYVGGDNLQLVSNPAWLTVDNDISLLGTSGQNIDDIKRYLTREQIEELSLNSENFETTLLENCIKWQNVAPTAPDTLYCYPFDNSDPFTMTATPNIFFSGNQENFAFDKVHFNEFGSCKKEHSTMNVGLISIPKFSESGQLVLLDLETLECEVINF